MNLYLHDTARDTSALKGSIKLCYGSQVITFFNKTGNFQPKTISFMIDLIVGKKKGGGGGKKGGKKTQP